MISDLSALFEAKKTQEQVHELLDLFQVKTSMPSGSEDSHVAGILTEWDEFSQFDWKKFLKNSSKSFVLVDGRSL